MWGRLVACGRLAIGHPGEAPTCVAMGGNSPHPLITITAVGSFSADTLIAA